MTLEASGFFESDVRIPGEPFPITSRHTTLWLWPGEECLWTGRALRWTGDRKGIAEQTTRRNQGRNHE